MTIRKIDDKFRLISKKTGRNLGTYDTKAGAEKRERQIQYFKRMGEDAPANAVGGGQIAGLGIGPQGEPGVNLKKKNEVMPFKSFFKRKPPIAVK